MQGSHLCLNNRQQVNKYASLALETCMDAVTKMGTEHEAAGAASLLA